MTAIRTTLRYRSTRLCALAICLVAVMFSAALAEEATSSQPSGVDTSALSELRAAVHAAASAGLIADAQSDSTRADLADAPVYLVNLVVSDDLSEVHGMMEVSYTHQASQPVDEIAFHLYANGIGGRISVNDGRIDGAAAGIRLSDEETVAWIHLEQDLEEGQSITVALEFAASVPVSNIAHYGILTTTGRMSSLAHLLPLLAIFDGRWRVDLPPEYGDVLYADVGFYLVALEVPADTAVAGTGFEASRTTLSSERVRVTIAAGPVREVYLALMKDTHAVTTTSGGTSIRVFAPPHLASRAEQAGELIALALESFGDWLGTYPFSELDVVVAPTRAVGMEFPGAILIGESSFVQSSTDLTSRSGGPSFFEVVLVHETAHQWFHTIVGNDQTNLPWLDESVVQYVTWQHAEARYGAAGDEAFEQWLHNTYLRAGIPEAPLGLPTSAYSPSTYASVIYGKGPLFYASLEDEYGDQAILAALQLYLDEFRWKNGTTAGIRAALEASCGCSLGPWFEAWIYGN